MVVYCSTVNIFGPVHVALEKLLLKVLVPVDRNVINVFDIYTLLSTHVSRLDLGHHKCDMKLLLFVFDSHNQL